MRTSLALSFILVASALTAQSPASGCFFEETFDGPLVPAGWSIGSPVLLLGTAGDTLGGSTDAWTVGNSNMANANGYFEVPNFPPGNSFIMANDDAAPCNCDMSNIELVAPALDLSTRSGTILNYRIFHEGQFGVGNPELAVSTNGGTVWQAQDTVQPVLGQWQQLQLDLSAFDGQSDVRVRFTWSDSLIWSGGIAIDDFCVSERFDNDVTLVRLFTEAYEDAAFNPQVRTQEYTTIPLTQVDTLTVGAEVHNSGTQTLNNIEVNITVNDPLGQIGIYTTPSIATLAPGESQRVFVRTDYKPNVDGPVQLNATTSHAAIDDDSSDDNGIKTFDVTAPGMAYAYSVMGAAGATPEFMLENDSVPTGFGSLIETKGNGDRVYGIGVILGQNTAPGTRLQAFLLDETLQGIDTSSTLIVDPSHLSQSAAGNYMYFGFDTAHTITQDRDLFAFIYSEGGAGEFLSVATSGTASLGGAIFFDGTNSSWDFPIVAPMIRTYFSNPFAVAIAESAFDTPALLCYPNPATDRIIFQFHENNGVNVTWEVYASNGVLLQSHRATDRFSLDVSNWANGAYVVRAISNGIVSRSQFFVTH